MNRVEVSDEPVVAFDCDGTLWSGDVGEDLYDEQVRSGLFRPLAYEAMRAEAVRHGFDPSGPAPELARRLHALEARGEYPQEQLYELMAWALAGHTRAEVRATVTDVLTSAKIIQRVRPETRELLSRLRGRGYRLIAVSASTRPLIEVALELLRIETHTICAATPLWAEDLMLPDVHRPIPYGPGKVHTLREVVDDTRVAVALGDNGFDADMLRLARVPIAVHPKDALRAAAHDIPGLVELDARDG